VVAGRRSPPKYGASNVQQSQWISVVYGLALLVVLYPAMRRLERGTLLRNIILWLVIFGAVGLAYRLFHPEP
jgi:hypothetical protein